MLGQNIFTVIKINIFEIEEDRIVWYQDDMI